MLRNYFKIAIRQLFKNKSYVVINTLGMGVALACCVAAYIFVAFNIEFNNNFDKEKTRNMAIVMAHFEHQNGTPYQNMVAPTVMAPIAANDFTGIERFTRYISNGGNISYEDKSFAESVQFADSTFFEMFDLPLISGSYESFKNKQSIFVSKELSEKIFGTEKDPVGEIISIEIRNNKMDFIVGGILDKIPLNSAFYISSLVRVENYLEIYDISPSDWGEWRDAGTVFELSDISKIDEVSEQLSTFTSIRNEMKPDATVTSYSLIPFNEPIHEDDANWSYINSKISIIPILVFITLATFILLIACFNLTNTTIALTVKRFKEIGIRKVVGARRYQVISQFLIEITIAIVLAVIAGLGLSQIIVPEFMSLWGVPYGLEDLDFVNLFGALIFLLFISSLIAGSYPAINNSRFKPVSLLKGNYRVKGTNPLTRILLVGQFSISVIVLVAGVIFTLNSRYQKNADLGYDMDNVMIVSIQGPSDYQTLKNAISTNPKIEEIAVTDHHIGYFGYTNPIKIDTSDFETTVFEIGPNYFNVLGMEIIDGRDFIVDSELDKEKAAIIDQKFVETYEIEDPLNTKIEHQGKIYEVVGVVQDHFDQLWKNSQIDNGNFYRVASKEQYRSLVARVNSPDNLLQTKIEIEEEWKKLFPNRPFLGRTQEDVVYGNINQTNRNLTIVFLFLTVLGSLLSVSGIYSLANLNIEKRTKEIGIRKALGASISNIVRLINKEFVIIMGIAVILGGIIGQILTGALLDEIYSFHIDVSIFIVALCGLLIFAVGILTTSGTIFKAAHANPVDTLRSE